MVRRAYAHTPESTKLDALTVFDRNLEESRYLVMLYEVFETKSKRDVRAPFLDKMQSVLKPLTKKDYSNRSSSNGAFLMFNANVSMSWRDLRHQRLKALLRMALVQTVASMDAYFHDQIEWHFGSILSTKFLESKKELKSFSLPVGQVKYTIDNYKRTTVGLRRAFECELRKKPIQSARQIDDNLKIIGVTGFWGDTAREMGVDLLCRKPTLALGC